MSAGTKITVGVRNNDVEFALRKFKNQVARNGNLSKARERADGLTQKQVAKKLDTTITYISLIENGGRNPSDKMKEKMAKLYGCSIADIFLAIKLTKC